jgi:putative DNA primase/helicase
MNAHTQADVVDAAAIPAPALIARPRDLSDLRLKLRAGGYHPVPVIGAHIKTDSAGKRPKMSGWQDKCLIADVEEIAGWSASTSDEADCTNTGLLCGEIVGVDIDVLDADLSAKLAARAQELLGLSSLRRIGRAPKVLFVYRVETPHEKHSTPNLIFGSDPTDKNAKAKVEILAKGQQFVAFGIHPDTRQLYDWPEQSPLDVPVADVPLVTTEKLQQFVAEAEQVLREAGARTAAEIKAEIKDNESKSNATSVDNFLAYSKEGNTAADKPSREKIADALDHVVNDLEYDDWIKIGFALYDGLGDSGRDLWEAWSATYSGNDPRVIARKWPSFAKGRSTKIATLFWFARQNGWWWKDDADRTTDKPTIQVVGGKLPEVVTQAEQALIKANLSLYQRGSMIVKPSLMHVDIADNKTTMAIRLAPVHPYLLVEMMTRAATFKKYDARSKDWVIIDAPEKVANTLLAREQWTLPVLAGVVNCPVLRADGSILENPGYDVETGLLFDPQGAEFTPVPQNPSKDDARRALEVLIDLISTFPFVSNADRSVALSGILTAIHRRSLPTAPLHGFSAPGAGTGKSKLVDIASLIVDGREAAVMALGNGEGETEKRLGAALLAGDAIVSIDNVDADRSLGGELLCQALTQKMLKIRILGLSKLEVVPTNAALFANGNNLTLVGDMTRRAVMCTIDSGEERPELRTFDRNPLAMVRAERNKYVVAALTVLRAYIVAGKPTQMRDGKKVTPLGSFEEWSGLIRSALIWLGEADPCDTMEKIRKKDPKLGAMVTVISQWLEVIGYAANVTAKGLIDHATQEVTAAYPREFLHPEFRDALLIVAGDGGAINSLRLGKWLGANQDRFVLGYIVEGGERGGSKLWRLEPKEPALVARAA